MKRSACLSCVFAVLGAVTLVWAGSSGKSPAAMLKVGMGARAAALGEAYTALGGDVFAAWYNPAGLGRIWEPQVGLQHLVWFEQAGAEYVAAAIPFGGGRHVGGASVLLFHSGDLLRTFGDATGDYDPVRSYGSFTTANIVGALSYAYFAGRIQAGVSVKLVRDVVDDQAVQTGAFDAGIQAGMGRGLRLGVSALNLGGRLGGDALPGMARAGVVYEGVRRLRLPVEVAIPFDESRVKIGGGSEFWVVDWAAIRGGVRMEESLIPAGGLGFSWRWLSVDYAIAWFGSTLRETHRISVIYRFGETGT